MADDNKEEPEEEEAVPRPSFKLTYFPFSGRAASLRLAAHIGGISYTDEFVTAEEHKAAKQAGARRWSGLPELTIYDDENKAVVTIGQSNVCLKYIGLLTNLYPINPVQRALVDEILASVEDTRSAMSGKTKTKEDRDKMIAKDGALTYWMTKFETRFEENESRGNESGYVVGDEMTIADLKLFELLHGAWLIFGEELATSFAESFPRIAQHYKLIKEDEAVEEFLQKSSLRHSEFKADPTDEDIKVITYKGKFVPGSFK